MIRVLLTIVCLISICGIPSSKDIKITSLNEPYKLKGIYYGIQLTAVDVETVSYSKNQMYIGVKFFVKNTSIFAILFERNGFAAYVDDEPVEPALPSEFTPRLAGRVHWFVDFSAYGLDAPTYGKLTGYCSVLAPKDSKKIEIVFMFGGRTSPKQKVSFVLDIPTAEAE